jgi:hypothetical protein
MPTRRAALLAMTAAALAAGCAHTPRPEVARATGDLRCEDAARLVAARARTRPLDELRRSATLPLSLVASGAGWVTDGVVIVSAGVAMGGLVCTPIFALEVAARSNGEASAECFVRTSAVFMDATPSPGVGPGVYRATRSWRCPDFVQLSREVRAVAACYEARGAPGDRELALQHLLQLRGVPEIWKCLPGSERHGVDGAAARLAAPRPGGEPPPPDLAPPPSGGAPPSP